MRLLLCSVSLICCVGIVISVKMAGKNQCCETKFIGGATYVLKEVDTTLPECQDNCVYGKKDEPGSRYCFKKGTLSSTCGIADNDETSNIMTKLEALTTIVQQNVCPGSISKPGLQLENSLQLKVTQMSMAKTQSEIFRGLTDEEQEKFLIVTEENGAYHLPKHCPLDKLRGCNENQAAIKECFDTSVNYSSISTCLNPGCPGCGAALAHLLGFDVNTKTTSRFITKTNTSSVLGNILSTPYALTDDPAFETHMYIDGNGMLKPYEKMTVRLARHRKYWEDRVGRTKSLAAGATVVSTIINTADKLVDVLSKTKTLLLKNLEKAIKEIDVTVKGITADAKKNIEEATSLLYTSEVKVQKTRQILEALAKETVERVNSLLYFLGKVKDDWDAAKIEKYLHFQAKKMTLLVDRSLTLLEEADELYTTTRENLAKIRARLEAFNIDMKILADDNSDRFKDEVQDMRLKIYLPCCIPCPFCCPICAIGLETAVNEWKSSLNRLLNTIKGNKEVTTRLQDEAKATQDKLGEEVGALIIWGGALNRMSEVDWTFEEAEIFGFADVRPELVNKLDNLKRAAQNYLAING